MQPDTVVIYPDACLSARAVVRQVDEALRDAGQALLATAERLQAYGLAAAHIGLVEPVVVISLGAVETRDYRILFNPEILALSGDEAAGTEGSVSLPGIEVDVTRASAAEIGFDDADGLRQSLALEGFAARVAQHEIDQVNGIFFLDRLSRLKRDAALRRFRKQARR